MTTEAGLQPYTWLLYRAVGRLGVEVTEYRTTEAMRRRPDVVHLHWPDSLLRHTHVRRYWRAGALLVSLSILRWRGTAVVYTAHNAEPHDLPLTRFDRWFLRCVDRKVDTVLLLTDASRTELLDRRPSLRSAHLVHTRHGHFRDAVPAPPPRIEAKRTFGIDTLRTTVAFVGQVRPYKGVTELLDAAQGLDLDVIIAGRCLDPTLHDELFDRASADPRLHLLLRNLARDELTTAVAAADLVVLPYRRVLNSGSALLALSLDRPVLVPSVPAFEETAAEVGSQWMRRFDGPRLTAADLTVALQDLPAGRPNLDLHEWELVAASTIEGYESAIAARRGVEKVAHR